MKYISIFLNIVLLILVVILFYWHFSSRQGDRVSEGNFTRKDSAILSSSGFKIAYVNLDSLEANYVFFRESSAAFTKKQAIMENELNNDARSLQQDEAQLQQKASTMTQADGETAQKTLMQRQQVLQEKEQNMRQELLTEQANFQDVLQGKMDKFLARYNADKKFSYILSYSKGQNNILYKDSAFDITNDVIAGLNADSSSVKK